MSADAAPAAFEVLDALGWCHLQRRSPDLDGSIPLRAARACVPLLEGNAHGWLLSADRPLVLRRRRGGWMLDDDARVSTARACVPYLVAHGLISAPWAALLADGPVSTARRFAGAVALWTGLLVRAGSGAVRVGDAGNRRNRDVDVDEVVLGDRARWVPLVLELRPREVDRIALGRELATVTSVPTDLELRTAPLEQHRALAEAHLAFYDAAYFADKRRGPTKKYRAALQRPAPTSAPPHATVAHAGPPCVTIEPAPREHDGDGPRAGTTLTRFVFHNLVGFSARDDGIEVHIDADRDALERSARAIEATWAGLFGAAELAAHQGALWYLTKYFTPHVPGEPHFFVKPPALFVTPPGVSMLVDGVHGRGYDVMRGLVRTDRFGALPAVFALERGVTIEVPAGRALARLLPVIDGDHAPRHHPALPTAAVRP